MRRLLGALVLACLTIGAIAAAACSSSNSSPNTASAAATAPAAEQNSGGTGTVGAQLTLPGGEHLSVVSYTLTDVTNTYTGSEAISSASTVSFVISSVAAGNAYTLSVNGISDDGLIACTSTAGPFTVSNRVTTVVNMNMACTTRLDSGSLLIGSVWSNCPIWNTLLANPNVVSTTAPNNTTTLVAGATAPNYGTLTFTWSASAGTLSSTSGTLDPNSNDAGAQNETTFTCPSTPGPVTISLAVSDGQLPEGGGCPPTYINGSITVNCESPQCQFGTGCGDGGQVCNSAGQCVPALFSVLVVSSLDGGVLDNNSHLMNMSVQNFSLTGPVGSPILIPSDAAAPIPVSIMGNHTTAGDLTTSLDGMYLSVVGFDSVSGLTGPASPNPVITRIAADGGLSQLVLSNASFQAAGMVPTDYRSVVTPNGNDYWLSVLPNMSDNDPTTTAGGIWYAQFDGGGSTTQITPFPNPNPAVDPLSPNTPTAGWGVSSRWVRVFEGQLYAGADWSPPYLFPVGTGLPTQPLPNTSDGGPPALPSLPGFFSSPDAGIPSPFSFVMFDIAGTGQPDTIYLADDGMNARVSNQTDPPSTTDGTNTGNGGLYKFRYSSTNGWQQMWRMTGGTFPADAGSGQANNPIGFRGLAGYATGTVATLMATTANITGSPDGLVVVLQDQVTSTTAPAIDAGATAIVPQTPTNMVYRGVSLTPQ